MSSKPITTSGKQQVLLKVMKVLVGMPAQVLYYGSALLAIWSTGGVNLPGVLGTMATAVGMNVLTNILERIAQGDEVSHDEVRKTVDDAIRSLEIDKVATSNEVQRAIAHMFRQFDLTKYAVQRGEINLTQIIFEQFSKLGVMIEELQAELNVVREQNNEILENVQRMAEVQKITLEGVQNISLSNKRIFPTTLVDQTIEKELDRLRKSRFYAEFDRVDFSITLANKLIDGEFSGGTNALRGRALAWCARILAFAENINKAEEYLDHAKRLGPGLECEIAHSFIYSQKGQKDLALSLLAGINNQTARSAAYIIVAQQEGQEKSIAWLKSVGLTTLDLDPDSKRFHLTQLHELALWEAAIEYIPELTGEDLLETPILNHMIAVTYLVSTVPDELRMVTASQTPFEAAGFPLASDMAAMDARRAALRYFISAAQVAKDLNCYRIAAIDDEYALWLELMDPAENLSGRRKLESKIRESEHALRYVHLAIQFGIKLSAELIEQEIDKDLALHGGYTMDTAMARFALVYTKKTPKDAAIYVSQYYDQITKFLNKKFLLSFQMDMYLKSGLIDKAKECLDIFLLDGISIEEETHIRRRISEFEGNDAVEVRKEQYRISNSLIDLANLIDEVESREDWDNLGEYRELMFNRTRSLHDAERLVYSWSHTLNYQKTVEFLSVNTDILTQSKMLQFHYCISLYYEGEFSEARSELKKLGDNWDNPNYRALEINLGIALGDWNALLLFVAKEFAVQDKRNAQELLFAAELAINLGSPHAKDLIFAAAEKGKDDPRVLATAYFLVSSAGWENEAGVFNWIERAAELSDDDGPIKKMTIKDILDRKPEWDRRETEMWNSLSRGDIPMFLAARYLNKSLLDLMLFPALANPLEVDPRRRSAIPAYSGAREATVLGAYTTVGLDSTTLLTLSYLNLLGKAFDAFQTIYLPHSTLAWLFEEKRKATFHQPSRIKGAHHIRHLLAVDVLEKFLPSVLPDSELSMQIGDELATFIGEAEKPRDADNTQHIVIRSSPVHNISSLLEEEADLTMHASVLSSCLAIIEKLRQIGHITSEEENRSRAYLQLQEKPWLLQPEIADGATLYLDDLSVVHFLHLGILDKLRVAGFRVIISPRKIAEVNELISYESISGKVNDFIEAIRHIVNSGIEAGKIKFGRQHDVIKPGEPSLAGHPTLGVIALAKNCDAVIVDERFLNQHGHINFEAKAVPIFSTIELMEFLVTSGLITSDEKLEYRTLIRRAGYFFIPLSGEELAKHLDTSIVKEEKIIEKAELKAIRENILRVRMSNWLQFPKEAAWFENTLRVFTRVLKDLWKPGLDLDSTRAKSDWIIDQVDIRGWAHRLDKESGDNLVKNGQGMHILSLLMPPVDVPKGVQNEYWNWIEERILAPIQEQDPALFAWIVEWQRKQIAKMTDLELPESDEEYDE